uniref:Uncharacterized protein n=1 Tax=viral metagenome TaxID=1070528 RepID=A0A6C0I0W4_9ZZZZ
MSEKDCMKTICKLALEKSDKFSKDITDILEKNIEKNENKPMPNKCKLDKNKNKLECDEKERKNKINETKKIIKKLRSKTYKKHMDKIVKKRCRKTYCNKGCKGTILEEGNGSQLPKSIKVEKELKKIFQENRKKIFGNKTNVLKDNFYEGLKPSVIKKLQNEGAISGCITKIIELK